MPAVGVSVAVQVRPPSAVARLLSVALSAVKSDRSKALTFSLKLMVTVAVSPTFRALLSSTMLCTVGTVMSTA